MDKQNIRSNRLIKKLGRRCDFEDVILMTSTVRIQIQLRSKLKILPL